MEFKFDNNLTCLVNDKFIKHLQRLFGNKLIKQVIPVRENTYAVLISHNEEQLWYLVIKNKKRYSYIEQHARTFMELILIYIGIFYSENTSK